MQAHMYVDTIYEEMSLKELREEIEAVDDEIIRCIRRRMDISIRIAEEKETHGIPVHDPDRAAEVLQRAENSARNISVDEVAIRDIFSILVKMSEDLQEKRRD